MFFRNNPGWEQENSATVQSTCSHCNNTTEHVVYVAPAGIHVGFIFSKKPLLGRLNYFLACPTCGTLAQQISKEQAHSLRS